MPQASRDSTFKKKNFNQDALRIIFQVVHTNVNEVRVISIAFKRCLKSEKREKNPFACDQALCWTSNSSRVYPVFALR